MSRKTNSITSLLSINLSVGIPSAANMRILLYRTVVVPSDAPFLRSFEKLLLLRLPYDPIK